MKIHDPAMQFKDDNAAKEWQASVDRNNDPYGAGVMRFASEWCTRMEGDIAARSVPMDSDASQIRYFVDNARRISHEADSEGITGFMYGCAMAILAEVWVYGENLRRWHNKDTQIGTEGDRANESGGVLNPALLNIASPAP